MRLTLAIRSRVDWFKPSDLNQVINHDLNQTIKFKKSCHFRYFCDVYDTFN